MSPVAHPGGAEMALLRFVDHLPASAWEVTLTAPHEGPLTERASASGYRWSVLPVGGLAPRSGARAIASWPQARRLARDAHIVYLNGTVSGRLLPALPAGAARRVLHIHDIVDRVPRFWHRADVVLAASQAVADRLDGLNAHVVYCPVDGDPPATAAPWPSGTGPVIGFVGRIEPRKGPLELVRAAPAIRRELPSARIVIVGEDPYRSDDSYTRAVIESPEIEHYPWHDNAPGLMRHMDVLVLPSRQEPFGTVLAEAMAVGTPVVATDVGGLSEVVVDGVTGRLVPPDDGPALVAAVLDVLARRAELGSAAREHARRFGAPAYAERVERLISA